jgi:hypothetical protein
MKLWFILLPLCLLCHAFAQDGRLNRAQPKPLPQAPSGPVTTAEVNAFFARVEGALATLPGMSGLKPSARKDSPTPAQREYVIREMGKLFDKVRPNFKFTPRKVQFDANKLVIGKAERPVLEKLIEWGCISRVGVLATGPGPTIDLIEFGDAMGFFVARLSELSHTPDPKFSPGMMDRIR